MINTAGFQQMDTLLNPLMGSGIKTSGSTDPQAALREIEQLMASMFGGGFAGGLGEDYSTNWLNQLASSTAADIEAIANSPAANAPDPGINFADFSTGGTGGAQSSGGGIASAKYNGGGTHGKPVADWFVGRLQHDFNLTKNQASGIVANLWYESGGMNPAMNEGMHVGAPSSNMGQGYGIAQWTGSRKQDFLNFASKNGMDPSSVEANYAYLKHELQTTHADAITAVKRTTSAQEATSVFCDVFEVPGVPAKDKRYDALAQVLGTSGTAFA